MNIRKKLDTVWAEKVKENANNKCEYCGRSDTLNSHHFYSRSNASTRWSLDNGFCLCVAHHTFSSSFSAHKAPADFVEWAKEYRGAAWYKKLREEKNKTVKYTTKGLNELYLLLCQTKIKAQ